MYIQSYLYNPKIYHIVGSDNKYSGKWQRRVPFGFTDQNAAVYQDTNLFLNYVENSRLKF
jgi:hypothetical protein